MAACLCLCQAFPAFAQEPPPPNQPASEAEAADQRPGRLFGVLPNVATVEEGVAASPVTTKQGFTFATEDSFDKVVFPFVAVVAKLGVGQPSEPYWKRYTTALADNTAGNFMVTAVLPAVFHQDPRYFVLGTGSIWHRAYYAASRTVVTRSRDGRPQFNVSEIGGNALAGLFSDAYYPAAERSASKTLARAGSQVMWDTLSAEAKEFWPDIRRTLHRTFHRE